MSKKKKKRNAAGREYTAADGIVGRFEEIKRRTGRVVNIWTAALLIPGILLLIWPGLAMSVLCRVIGIVLLLYGILMIARFISGGADRSEAGVSLIGILLIIVGVYIAARPATLVNVVGFVLGIFLLAYGVNLLVFTIRNRFARPLYMWGTAAGMILSFITGLLFLFAPYESSATMMRVIGAALLYTAVSGIVFHLRANRMLDEAENEVRRAEDDFEDEQIRRTNRDRRGMEVVDSTAEIMPDDPKDIYR